MSCGYVLEVLSKDDVSISFKLIETTAENMEGATLQDCEKLISNEKSIPLEQVTTGKELLNPKAQLKAKQSSYSGMGPKGPISSKTWEFFKL